MTAAIVNSSSTPLTSNAVVAQGSEPGSIKPTPGITDAKPPSATDFIDSHSRPGLFSVDAKSQGPPATEPAATANADTSGTELPTGGNFLPLLFLSVWRQQPDPTTQPPATGTVATPLISATSAEPLQQTQTQTQPSTVAPNDLLAARRPGAFEPFFKTAHQVLELLRPTESSRPDPTCQAQPTTTDATDGASLASTVVTATTAVAQAAPDLLTAILKNLAPKAAPAEPVQSVDDLGVYVPLAERGAVTGGPTNGAAVSFPAEFHPLIESLPRPPAADAMTPDIRDVAKPTTDAPMAALFVDGHGLRTHAANAAPADAAQNLRLDVPMRSPEWGHALGEKISWMVDQNLATAQIKLNPPQLGPIEVRIALNGDSTQVAVSAHNLVTRDALEAAAPRLREALSAHGLGNVSVDISQHSFSDRPMMTSRPDRWEAWQSLSEERPAVAFTKARDWQTPGRLDAYA